MSFGSFAERRQNSGRAERHEPRHEFSIAPVPAKKLPKEGCCEKPAEKAKDGAVSHAALLAFALGVGLVTAIILLPHAIHEPNGYACDGLRYDR